MPPPPLPVTLCWAIAHSEAHVRGLADLIARHHAQGRDTGELEAWLRATRAHRDGLREARARLLARKG